MKNVKTTREALLDYKKACDTMSQSIKMLLEALPAEYLDLPSARSGGLKLGSLYYERYRQGPSAS